mmetsp:Transcript_36386/g.43826  ORF Transcript_36386/g.43826 Transcript_36386/m.43826 type:complete len:665 (-) Transcript_36386:187-2181(-)
MIAQSTVMRAWNFPILQVLLVGCLCANKAQSFTCNEGYTCFEEEANDVVWVMAGGTGSPCSDVCESGISGSAEFKCKSDQITYKNKELFDHIAQGLGYDCNNGSCWNSSAGNMMWVERGDHENRNCYFPKDADLYSCSATNNNANCFGERYQMVCPCEQSAQVPTPAPICSVESDPFPCNEDEGFSCWKDNNNDIVWVMGGGIFDNCRDTCLSALDEHSEFYACKSDQPIHMNIGELDPISTGLGFSCKKGDCWDGRSVDGETWIDNSNNCERNCYFPETEGNYGCHESVGNANCFRERYTLVCPCNVKALDEACEWSCPEHSAHVAKWPNVEEGDGTSCLERINYWRKKACEDGWPECPPAGLPPMVECTSCHQCANSQSEYDAIHGSHKSFQRCGEYSQGSGGGRTCKDVIDAFVSERESFDGLCKGHCGPIVGQGCDEFHWGRTEEPNGNGFYHYTLNWGNCNKGKCDSYCDAAEPGTGSECFASGIDTPGCSNEPITEQPSAAPTSSTDSPNDKKPVADPSELPTFEQTNEPSSAPTTAVPDTAIFIKKMTVKRNPVNNDTKNLFKFKLTIKDENNQKIEGAFFNLNYSYGSKSKFKDKTSNKKGIATVKFKVRSDRIATVVLAEVKAPDGYFYDEDRNYEFADDCPAFSEDCRSYEMEN